MYCIKEFITCKKCSGDSTLNSVDYINGIYSYECINCYEILKLRIDNILVDNKMVTLFSLRENGQISYKCGNCGSKILINISNRSADEIEEVIKNAYEGVCANCIDDRDIKCYYCNKNISSINNTYYTDKKNYKIFCDKKCYLKQIELEYY